MPSTMDTGDGESDFPTPSIEYEYVWINKFVFLAVLGLDGLAFLFCICCAIAITFFRKHLTFVNTGVALNSVFIVGCIMMLMSVPLFGIDSNLADKISIPKACMARIWFLSVGYSLSVGIMIVRVIYTAFMELAREFKSYKITPTVILFFVTSMAIMDTIVVIAWRWFSPPRKDYVTKEIELIGIRDERRTLVETCNSDKESLLIGFLCMYKGGLLVVAMIVSIFKREEEENRSADYNKCQVGLLSVLVSGAIGLPVVLSLPYNPNKSFAVGGIVIILEVCFLMAWLKMSKIYNAHKCKKGEALEFGKYAIEKGSRCVACVRPVYGCVYDIKSQGFFNEGYDLDSVVDIKDADPESIKGADEENNLADSGIGFDYKVSEDVLPDDLPSHDEYDMQPYDPDAQPEEKEEEEEETDDEAEEKPEGETSDDSSNSSSDDENVKKNKENASTIARSAVSFYLNNSTQGSHATFKDDNNLAAAEKQSNSNLNSQTESRIKSTGSSRKGWWKPLFGGKKEPEKSEQPAQNKDEESESSESETEAPAKESSSNPNIQTDNRHESTESVQKGQFEEKKNVQESESSESETEAPAKESNSNPNIQTDNRPKSTESVQKEQLEEKTKVQESESSESEAEAPAEKSNGNLTTNNGKKRWWKPMFGRKKKPKKSKEHAQNKGFVQDDTTNPNVCEEEKVEESESSKRDIEAPPKRCMTPHGGSESEYDESDDNDSSGESDSN